MKTGCPSANRDKVRGGPTGSSDEEPQRREEQPDEKVLRWTGRSQQEQRVRDRGRGWKGNRAGRSADDAGRVSQLQATYQLTRGTRVALETGTVAFFVARQLGRLGLDPIVVDAHEVRLKAHRPNQKSDGRDAFELCEGSRRGIYRSIVHVPGQEVSRLRDTLSRRRHLVRLQAAQVGVVKALLRAAGLGRLSRSLGGEAGWAG